MSMYSVCFANTIYPALQRGLSLDTDTHPLSERTQGPSFLHLSPSDGLLLIEIAHAKDPQKVSFIKIKEKISYITIHSKKKEKI